MFSDPIKAHAAFATEIEPVLLLGFEVMGGALSAIVCRRDGAISTAHPSSLTLDWRIGKDGRWEDLEGDE
jgi:hypothetical protein